jgi:hypothetical protein
MAKRRKAKPNAEAPTASLVSRPTLHLVPYLDDDQV